MIERSQERFALYPERLIGDTAYGSAEMLDWLVHDRGIEPHIPAFDKSQRTDGTFSRDDFTYDHTTDTYRCPAGKTLQHYRRRFAIPRAGVGRRSGPFVATGDGRVIILAARGGDRHVVSRPASAPPFPE